MEDPHASGQQLQLPQTAVIGFRDYYAPISSRGYKAVVQIEKRYPRLGETGDTGLSGLGSGHGSSRTTWWWWTRTSTFTTRTWWTGRLPPGWTLPEDVIIIPRGRSVSLSTPPHHGGASRRNRIYGIRLHRKNGNRRDQKKRPGKSPAYRRSCKTGLTSFGEGSEKVAELRSSIISIP